MSRVNIRIYSLVIRSERVRHRRLRNADVGTSPRTRDKQANEQVYVTKHELARDVANKQVSSDGCQRASYRGGSKSLIQLRLDVSAVQEVVVRLGVPSAKLRGGTRAGEPPGGRAPSHAIADAT